MKLFNAIAIYDVFIVAETPEAARTALLGVIRDGSEPIPPSEITALETRSEGNIRSSWRDEKPFVADDISDADFNRHVKGHTTVEIFQHIYTKRG